MYSQTKIKKYVFIFKVVFILYEVYDDLSSHHSGAFCLTAVSISTILDGLGCGDQ